MKTFFSILSLLNIIITVISLLSIQVGRGEGKERGPGGVPPRGPPGAPHRLLGSSEFNLKPISAGSVLVSELQLVFIIAARERTV